MEEEVTRATRVLVADDDQAIRRLVCTVIGREGLTADCASDGAEAIELLREREYSVILLDLMMPRIDGFGVIDYLQNNPPALKPIVLVVTAYADQKFKQVDPAVVAGVLRKPFEIADLGAIVKMCVQAMESAGAAKPALDSAAKLEDQALPHPRRRAIGEH